MYDLHGALATVASTNNAHNRAPRSLLESWQLRICAFAHLDEVEANAYYNIGEYGRRFSNYRVSLSRP